jgi:hypothetical protein
MWRKIEVQVDTFALLWAARIAGEATEDEIIARLVRDYLGSEPSQSVEAVPTDNVSTGRNAKASDRPRSEQWVHVLLWSLCKLGGEAHLSQIYRTAREGREALGKPIRRNHEATVRERLESYCSTSQNYKGIADLFWQPKGKGSGIWAVRQPSPTD